MGYLCGSLPFSQIVALAVKQMDLRVSGFRNVGAYNVLRHVGVFWGFLAGGLDVAKGLAAMGIANRFDVGYPAIQVTALSVIIGHNYPIWLGFRGGKGVNAMIGILLWFAPLETLIGFAIACLFFLWKRRVNIAAPVGAIAVLLLTWKEEHHQQIEVFLAACSIIIAVSYLPRFYHWLKKYMQVSAQV